MRVGGRRAGSIIAVGAIAACWLTPPGALGQTPLVGFNDNFPNIHSDAAGDSPGTTMTTWVRKLSGAHAQLVRMPIPWAWAEPQRGRWNATAFRWFDQLYAALGHASPSIQLVMGPMVAPNWARAPATRTDVPGSSCFSLTGFMDPSEVYRCIAPPVPAFYGDYATFAAKLAARYPLARAIEVWNEPNTTAFWHPAPNVGDYANLLQVTSKAVRAVQPRMTILNGGLAGFSRSDAHNVATGAFLSAMYRLGTGQSFDAISYHAYPAAVLSDPLTPVRLLTAAVRQARDGAGDLAKPLWITEYGACGVDLFPGVAYSQGQQPACPGNGGGSWSEERQGAIIVQGHRWMTQQPDLAAGLFHDLFEDAPRRDPFTWSPPGDSGVGEEFAYGLVEWALNSVNGATVFRNKPGYCVVARELGGSCP